METRPCRNTTFITSILRPSGRVDFPLLAEQRGSPSQKRSAIATSSRSSSTRLACSNQSVAHVRDKNAIAARDMFQRMQHRRHENRQIDRAEAEHARSARACGCSCDQRHKAPSRTCAVPAVCGDDTTERTQENGAELIERSHCECRFGLRRTILAAGIRGVLPRANKTLWTCSYGVVMTLPAFPFHYVEPGNATIALGFSRMPNQGT
jgi:hypothetical protein